MYDPWNFGGLNPSFFVVWGGLAPLSPYVEPPLLAPSFGTWVRGVSDFIFLARHDYDNPSSPSPSHLPTVGIRVPIAAESSGDTCSVAYLVIYVCVLFKVLPDSLRKAEWRKVRFCGGAKHKESPSNRPSKVTGMVDRRVSFMPQELLCSSLFTSWSLQSPVVHRRPSGCSQHVQGYYSIQRLRLCWSL